MKYLALGFFTCGLVYSTVTHQSYTIVKCVLIVALLALCIGALGHLLTRPAKQPR